MVYEFVKAFQLLVILKKSIDHENHAGMHVRIRRIAACENTARSHNSIHENRIVDAIECMNAHCLLCLQTYVLETCRKLSDDFSTLLCSPELGSVRSIHVNLPVLIEPWTVKIPRQDVLRGNAVDNQPGSQ